MRSFALYIRVEISVPWNLQFLEAIHNKKLFYAWPWLVVVEGTRLEFKCILSQFHFSKERANWWEERVVAFSGNQEFLQEFRFFVGRKCKFLKILHCCFFFPASKRMNLSVFSNAKQPKVCFQSKSPDRKFACDRHVVEFKCSVVKTLDIFDLPSKEKQMM